MNSTQIHPINSREHLQSYHVPQVKDLGSLVDLTKSGPIPVLEFDGGIQFPNVYTSGQG